MKETLKNVEWDETKFKPKQMTLNTLNLAKLKDSRIFQDRSVQMSYNTAVLTVGFHTTQEHAKPNSIVKEQPV